MNKTERNLVRDLHTWATGVDVDVEKIRRGLTEEPQRDTSGATGARRRHLVVPVIAAAAAGAAIAAGSLVANLGDGGPGPAGPTSTLSKPVESIIGDTWSCPHHTTVDIAAISKKAVHFKPGAVPDEATFERVPRFQFDLGDRHGRLKYADKGGRLMSVTALEKTDDGRWKAVSRTLCAGADGSSLTAPTRTTLGRHVDEPVSLPKPLDKLPALTREQKLVVVDDRYVYNQVGGKSRVTRVAYLKNDEIWEYSADSIDGVQGSYGSSNLSSRPDNFGGLFVSTSYPFAAPQRDFLPAPEAVALVVDDRSVVKVTVRQRVDGQTFAAQSFTAPGWNGRRLFAAQARTTKPTGYVVTLIHKDGRTTTYRM